MVFGAACYVRATLGASYTEAPVLDLRDTLRDSTPLSPLIFVLSPGVDPTQPLRKLAVEMQMEDRLCVVALGQGQAPIAMRLIERGIRDGHWIFLANCHLMTRWLPTLEKILQELEAKNPHPDFRLWLSSNPSPLFPMSILQRGIKMTTEPPKGLHANLHRLYHHTIEPERLTSCTKYHAYSKLLFALAYFHSTLLERRKFRSLGFNIAYDFNDTDFRVSDDLLRSYLESYREIPWDALRYLIAEANYGGRVTDELDRRVLNSYLNRFYCEAAVHQPRYPLADLDLYCIPEETSIGGALSYIQSLPLTDAPEAFGQHPNAEISYLREEGQSLVDTLVRLQPTARSGGAASSGPSVEEITESILRLLPAPFDLDHIRQQHPDDAAALNVVLLQETERYNALLSTVQFSCTQLLRGIKGWIVMSADLDEIYAALRDGRVPAAWSRAYPSLKPLASWTRDLLLRLEQFAQWSRSVEPTVFWLSSFTYPNGFLTAVLQTAARFHGVPIDALIFDVSVAHDLETPPDEGVYVRGFFLEGAGWDVEREELCEPHPMELTVEMPVLWFRPVEQRRRSGPKRHYSCPVYLTALRSGTRERPSFLTHIDLKPGTRTPDHWILRGTALLLSLPM